MRFMHAQHKDTDTVYCIHSFHTQHFLNTLLLQFKNNVNDI